MGASKVWAPLSAMEERARAGGSRHARATGLEEKIAGLGAWIMERTGPCQRERGAGRRSYAQPRASACKAEDAVTVALAAALRAHTEEMERAPVRSQREKML
jgi:hypothetical protein